MLTGYHPTGPLHVPSFKDRLRDMAERDIANLGLLSYPVLQTVDIAIWIRDDDAIRASVRSFITDPQKVRREACCSGALGCVDCKTILAEGLERVRPLSRATLAAVRRAMHSA